MAWKLKAITGDLTGQEILIEQDTLVGRHQDCNLVLQAAEISRRHAAFSVVDTLLWVQDLNSSNGTFVNDHRIDEQKQLNDGDTVQFASIKFQVSQFSGDLVNIEQDPTTSNQTDQGMPSLAERATNTALNREGMPQQIQVPKPAPIPEHAFSAEKTTESINIPEENLSSESQEQRKNATVGLFTLISVVILAIIAWLFFK